MRLALQYAALACLMAITGFAAPFTGAAYQTSCSTFGAPTVSGNTSCFSGPTGLANTNSLPLFGLSYAAATASVTSSIGGTGLSDVHAVQTTALGLPWAQPNSITVPPVSATSSAQFGAYLTTAGPVREGLLQIFLTNNSLVYPSSESISATFTLGLPGVQSSSCGITWSPCTAISYLNHYDSLGGFVVPLGTSFYLSYNGDFTAYAGGYTDGNGSGTLDLDYQFRFLEADGVTPVDVLAAAPEPASFSLLGIAFAAACLWKRRRRQ